MRAVREFGKGARGVTLGYRKRFNEALLGNGWTDSEADVIVNSVYGKLNRWLSDVDGVDLPVDDFKGALLRIAHEEWDKATR